MRSKTYISSELNKLELQRKTIFAYSENDSESYGNTSHGICKRCLKNIEG